MLYFEQQKLKIDQSKITVTKSYDIIDKWLKQVFFYSKVLTNVRKIYNLTRLS